MNTHIAFCVAALLVPAVASAQAEQCFPTCRTGFVCISGQCVSACNPVCGAGETCTAGGECVPALTRTAPVLTSVAQVTPIVEVERVERPTPGWARGAAVMGLVFAGTLMGATTFNELFLGESGVRLPVRLALHGTAAIMAPIVAGGAGSARDLGSVSGSGGSRAMGWLTYVLSLVSATSQLALGVAGVRIPYGPFMTQGLSSLSMVFFAIDGFVSSGQAESAAADLDAREKSTLRIAPIVSINGAGGSIGLAASF